MLYKNYHKILLIDGGIALGAGVNVLGGIFSNMLAKWREDEARKQNYQYNEMAAVNADRRTRDLYNDLQSPQALLQQYQQAGLSPSLMFGGSGIGGQTSQGAQGSGAAGISPTTYGVNPLEAANIALINAQTRKTNAEANNEEGTGAKGNAIIANLNSETAKNVAITALTNLQSDAQKLQNYILDETKEFSINEARADADKAATEAQTAIFTMLHKSTDAQYALETLQTRIDTAVQELENKEAQWKVMKSVFHLNAALTTESKERVKQGWRHMANEYHSVLAQIKQAKNQEEANKITKKYYSDMADYWDNTIAIEELKTDRQNTQFYVKTFTVDLINSFANVGNAVGNIIH